MKGCEGGQAEERSDERLTSNPCLSAIIRIFPHSCVALIHELVEYVEYASSSARSKINWVAFDVEIIAVAGVFSPLKAEEETAF